MKDKPSEWAMDMSRRYAAVSSAIRAVDAEGLAYILDSVRENARKEGLIEAADMASERASTRRTAAEHMHNAGDYRDAALYRAYATAEDALAGAIRSRATTDGVKS